MKALRCPFLTRIPLGQVRQHATELLQMADWCPVMGHVIRHSSTAATAGRITTDPPAKGNGFVLASIFAPEIVVLSD